MKEKNELMEQLIEKFGYVEWGMSRGMPEWLEIYNSNTFSSECNTYELIGVTKENKLKIAIVEDVENYNWQSAEEDLDVTIDYSSFFDETDILIGYTCDNHWYDNGKQGQSKNFWFVENKAKVKDLVNKRHEEYKASYIDLL